MPGCPLAPLLRSFKVRIPTSPQGVTTVPTVQTGRLNAGIALNVIPDYAEVEFEIRNLPSENPSSIVNFVRAYAEHELVCELRATAGESDIEWQQLVDYPGRADEWMLWPKTVERGLTAAAK